MKEKNYWAPSFIASIIINLGILAGFGYAFMHGSTPVEKPEPPVEVSIVSEPAGGGGGAPGPKIAAPTEAKVNIPPPPTNVAAAEKAIEQVEQTTTANPSSFTDVSPAPAPGPSSSSNGGGTGSGEGSGSGSGTGGGSGNGNGGGNGDGDGPGTAPAGPVEVSQLRVLSRVAPAYPKNLQRFQGNVTLRLVVGADGVPESVSVIGNGTGSATLAQNAVNAVYQWRFSPAYVNGVPRSSTGTLTVTFQVQYDDDY